MELDVQPPEAKRIPTSFTHHGITVEDPYAWLKDVNYPEVSDPQIINHLQAENLYFDAYMARLEASVKTIFQEIKERQPDEDESVPYLKSGWYYQWRFSQEAQYRTWYRASEEKPSQWELLLDEVALAEGLDFFRLGGLSVSPDGTRLAYSADTTGAERFTTRVLDLTNRKTIAGPIHDTLGAVVWAADSDSFYYVTVSEAWRPYRIWQHVFETQGDRLVYEEKDVSFFVSIDLAQSEKYVFINSGGHTNNEVYFVPRTNLAAEPRLISARRSAHEYHVNHGNGSFFIRSNRDHVNFDLYRTDEQNPQESAWEKIVSGDSRHYLVDHLPLADHLIVQQRIDGLDQIKVMCNGDQAHYIEFPEPTYHVGLGTNPNFDSATLRLAYTSMITPNTVYDYDLNSQQLTSRKVQPIPSGYDATRYITERLQIEARDGTKIPISLVRHTNTPTDGSAPLYLYAYGAYGISIPPSFSTTRLSLLDRGFIFAIAHIRGGDDLGYQWYLDGKLRQRTNTFNDFVDCARALITHNYTCAGQIAIAGGSAGGELMGAALNQAPELWGAVVAHVPFVDVLNTMLDESLPLTPLEWPEWGNPIEDAAAFRLIQSYSPYDQLKPGTYPPIMVTAGLNDPRVTYWEPAKFVARLRHLKTDENPLILKTNMGAGHAGKSGRFESFKETAEEYAFFIDLLEPGPSE